MTKQTNIDGSTRTPPCYNREHRKEGEHRQFRVETVVIEPQPHFKTTAKYIFCLACGRFWRSRSRHIDGLPHLQMGDLRGDRRVVDHLKLRLEWDDSKSYAERPHDHVLIEEIDELAHHDAAYRKVADLLGEALGLPTGTSWETVEGRLRKVINGGAPTPAPKWTEDQLAYDGSAEPQKRDLTPRERDILCRLLRDVPRGDAYLEEEELPLIAGMRDALTPRVD